MCNAACIEFASRSLSPAEIRGKAVLEVGSYNVNGSLRGFVESLSPSSYVGVDLTRGPGVDEICDAGALLERFGEQAFDAVICTELLEHVRDWRSVVLNLKSVLRVNGVLLITTRSYGYPYHGFPSDYWRYEISDMEAIFRDFEALALQADPLEPGVLLKARRPSSFVAEGLKGYRLYSIVKGRRVRSLTALDLFLFRGRQALQEALEHRLLAPWTRLRHAWSRRGSLPFGNIDAPAEGEAVRGEAFLLGWALAEEGIREVRICVDRKFRAYARIGEARPDVALQHPDYRSSRNSGWSAVLDVSDLSEGDHELTVQALSRKGVCGDLRKIVIRTVVDSGWSSAYGRT